MAMIIPPILREEKLVIEAEEFYHAVAGELEWSEQKLNDRLLEVRVEILSTGTYNHTSEELEIGARLAWRNSSKCIGRIAWNTLKVRDRRHVTDPEGIYKEVKEHLHIATCGDNIQSVMTVFRPRKQDETWGLRFWSSQFVRYAGYQLDPLISHKDANEDGILGDPANVEFTKYLIKNKLWSPPRKMSAFDLLPLVLKIPGRDKPFVYSLPDQYIQEVSIEHPDYPGIKNLGLKWAAVPAISNFNMNLGGINYNCCPFNGWFVSIEIVRNLMERYKIQDRWIEAMELRPTEKRMIEMRVQHEVQVAVLHSFDKAGFSIVDPCTVGKSFLVHCKRERIAGRECPGQWSWIGGLVGPTNVTWHQEMRDFYVAPQYEYASEPWKVIDIGDDEIYSDTMTTSGSMISSQERISDASIITELSTKLPTVLILFGSQTGTAEGAASKLCRALRMLKPMLMSLNDAAGLEIVKQRKITHIFAICSTFNRGEFPANASIFEKTPIVDGILSETNVAVLAVGSRSYADFCAAGVRLNGTLARAGAKQFMTITKVDDAAGSAGPINEWVKLVKRLLVIPLRLSQCVGTSWEETVSTFSLEWLDAPLPRETHNRATTKIDIERNGMSRFNWAKEESFLCVGNEELMESSDPNRSTRKVTFEIPECTSYETGDHLAVQPLNCLAMVARFVRCFEHELNGCNGATANSTDARGDDLLWKKMDIPLQIMEDQGDGSCFPAMGLSFKCPSTLSDILQSGVDLSFHESMLEEFSRLMITKGFDTNDKSIANIVDIGNEGVGERRQCCDLFAKILDEKTENKAQKNDAMQQFLSLYPTVVDFLEAHQSYLKTLKMRKGTSSTLSLVDLLLILPRLRERYYSISSSPNIDPRSVSITVGLVSFLTPAGKPRRGVCSSYLGSLVESEHRAKASIRTSNFRGPSSVDSSVIMVGPGTGIAPMFGFLQDRALAMKKREGEIETRELDVEGKDGEDGDDVVVSPLQCHLFSGCRSLHERIYGKEVDAWVKKGVVKNHLALSRSPDTPKRYVQDLMKGIETNDHRRKNSSHKERQTQQNDGEHFVASILLQNDSYYYVCGDARVANECYEVCISLLRRYGKMSRVGAVQHIQKMRAANRWQHDLWGTFNGFFQETILTTKVPERSAKAWLMSFQ